MKKQKKVKKEITMASNMSFMCSLGIFIVGMIVSIWLLIVSVLELASIQSIALAGTSIAFGIVGIMGICLFGWYNVIRLRK